MATLIGTPQASYAAAGATSINHSYGTAVASGDVAFVAVAGYHDTATVSSVTSSVATSSITQVGTLLRTSTAISPEPFIDCYELVFSASGTPTITGNYSATVGDRSLRSIVWRGLDATTRVEATAGAATSTDTPTSATGNIVQGNTGPISSFHNDYPWPAAHNHNVGTPNTGWTEWGDTATGGDNKYQNFASGGTRNGNFTWTDTGSNDFSVVRGIAGRDAGSSSDIAAAGALSIAGSADLDATGSLAAAGAVSITGVAALGGAGALAAAGALSISGSADIDARGVLAASGALSIGGAADLDGTGRLVAAGALSISGSAALTSSSLIDLTAAGALSITGAATLNARGTLAAAGTVAIAGAADLDASGRLTAAGALSITGSATLADATDVDVSAAGTLSITGSATLRAVGYLAAGGALVIGGYANLADANAIVGPPPRGRKVVAEAAGRTSHAASRRRVTARTGGRMSQPGE
jgi:hypothetical protein